MIPQDKIDEILSRSDIVDVVGAFVSLTKKGVNYQACCPFHDEKTPSFTVSPSKQIFKCFGCGEGGDAVGFIMKKEKLNYPEALKWLANRYKIEVADVAILPEEHEKQEAAAKRKASITTSLRMIQNFYTENLNQNSKALNYLVNKRQISSDLINAFGIGLAGNGNALLNFCAQEGLRTDFLKEIGILKEGKRGLYDPFHNRITFPIWDRFGNTIGFTGRILPEEYSGIPLPPVQGGGGGLPKYLNSEESEIYHKGKTLYGFHLAINEIRKTKTVYLVEGNTDCIRMHAIGHKNTVAQMGTTLTDDQINLLKKTDAETVILCYDSDKAGLKATITHGESLLKAGFAIEVLEIGDWSGDPKIDVDTCFINSTENSPPNMENIPPIWGDGRGEDYIHWRFNREYSNANTPIIKSGIIRNFAELLYNINNDTAAFYIDDLTKKYKLKRLLHDAYKKTVKANLSVHPDVRANNIRPDTLSPLRGDKEGGRDDNEITKQYGFLEEHNKYWFQRTGKYGSNFILKPLFHVQSVMKPKRIFSIINEHGIAHEIEIDQKDLISLAAFRLKVEGLGNFIWKTDEIALTQLKSYLYDNMNTCKEIEQLGWQPQGFWAWCNGIFYKNEFFPINEMGIVELPDNMGNYYLPALSKFYTQDKDIFESERRFIFLPENKISLYDFSKMMTNVFDNNAIILIIFYINTLFRDVIVKRTNNYPLLNLFGLKGTGKSELYHTMLQAFGHHPMAPNINSSSKASLGDHVAQYSNALCAIDEYKNSLEFEKIEFLKGLYNSTGRTRMNMDKDKKKETTKADAGIIFAGQEMPTADIALFSRCLYTTFTKTEHAPEETKKYEQLKEIASNGFTNITHEILSLREHFINNYDKSYETATELLTNEIENINFIESRILKNWLMILAGYIAIADKIKVYFTQEQIVKLFAKCIVNQNTQVQAGNEISLFWDIVEFLVKENLIENEIDYKIVQRTSLKTDKSEEPYQWDRPKNILFIDTGRIYGLYRKHAKQIIEQPLPVQSLQFYVKNSKEYIGSVNPVKFKVKNPDTGKIENYDEKPDPILLTSEKKYKYKITRALAFDYDKLQQNGINIHITETLINDYNDEQTEILNF